MCFGLCVCMFVCPSMFVNVHTGTIAISGKAEWRRNTDRTNADSKLTGQGLKFLRSFELRRLVVAMLGE